MAKRPKLRMTGGGFLPHKVSANPLLTPLEQRVLEAIMDSVSRPEKWTDDCWVLLRDLFTSMAERRTAFRLGRKGILGLRGLEYDDQAKRVRNPYMQGGPAASSPDP